MAVRIESKAEPIPGYRLIERLGGGGFGEVWKAEAPGGLLKAIKFVYGDLASAGEGDQRAAQELKALRRVQTVRHPYILSLERYDVIDGQLLIVMELADRNLWDRFRECRAQGLPGIPRDELLGYMEEVSEALDLMNGEYQLQHLDVKPQNLFLVHQHVKVADFGLVKDLEGMQASVTGGVTPVYAAPETFDGWVSRFSDQYSLAIVYQELLTGQRPFNGNNIRQLVMQHLQGTPDLRSLPPAEQPIIARSLAKEPDQRYPTCRDLVRSLRAAGVLPDLAGPEPEPDPAARPAPTPAPRSAPPVLASAGGETNGDPSSTHNIRKAGPRANGVETNGNGRPSRSLSGEGRAVEALAPRAAPVEVNGEGALFPALVVGVGQLGLTVLQRLREHLYTHFGGSDTLPNLRLLLLDTDPEVTRSATRSPTGASLTGAEVFLAPLNRPSYYLKAREGRGGPPAWLNPRMLYRIPRSQVTAGVRALGRLAFCDNYRGISRRLQTELDACLDPAVLTAAARQTGLGVRTNRPRVYVVAGLGGGTGSGMFLDVAYTLRDLLRRAGYEQPDVVGLFLLPPVDGNRTRTLTLGNAYAALTELGHFARPGTEFVARYDERAAPLRDGGPPFSRCVLLPLPDETDEVATRELAELAGQYLRRDLCSPLGRAADLARAGLSGPPWEERGLYYHTFGLFPVTSPRHAVLEVVGRRLCQRLVQRWASKDSKPVRPAVCTWVQERWLQQELGADSFIHRVQAEVARAPGGPAEQRLDEALAPLRQRAVPADIAPEEVADALARLEELLGRPGDERGADSPAVLVREVVEAAGRLGTEWGQKLAEMPVRLIEDPQFRLAGAEEAVRQMVATLEQALQHHEPLSRELAARAEEAFSRLQALAVTARTPRRGPAPDPVELLRSYAKCRYQGLVLQQVLAAFVGLRGHLSDELREIGFCRDRLIELNRLFEEAPAVKTVRPGQPGEVGRCLFPAGCKDLRAAVERVLERITPEALIELDAQMEALLRRDFTALVHVCLSSVNLLKNVQTAMLRTAEDFAAGYLTDGSAAALFLEHYPDPERAGNELTACYDEAAPEMGPGRDVQASSFCVLATPGDEAGEQVRALLRQVLPEAEVQLADSDEDVILYREVANLPLSALEHLGPVGHDAYVQMTATDHFTPHSRIDVDFAADR